MGARRREARGTGSGKISWVPEGSQADLSDRLQDVSCGVLKFPRAPNHGKLL